MIYADYTSPRFRKEYGYTFFVAYTNEGWDAWPSYSYLVVI